MKIKILYNYRIPLCLIMMSFLSLNSYADYYTFVINDQTGCYGAEIQKGSQLRWVIKGVNPGYRDVPYGGALSYTYNNVDAWGPGIQAGAKLVVTPSNKILAVFAFATPTTGEAKLTLNPGSLKKGYNLDLSKDGSTFTINVTKEAPDPDKPCVY